MSQKVNAKGQLRKLFRSPDEPVTLVLQFDNVVAACLASNKLGSDWRYDESTVLTWHGDYDALETRIESALGVPAEQMQPARHTMPTGPVFAVSLDID